MMRAKRGRADSGFTLVEVLAASVLLSIGLLAVLTAASGAREMQERAKYYAAARLIAQSHIESLRAKNFDQLPSMNGLVTTDPSLPAGNKIAVTVAPFTGVTDGNLYYARVQVTWPEASSTRTIIYETLIVRY